MKPVAAPGMHYRIFPDSTSNKHYTVVLLKDNSYLEVNNIDKPGVKTKFSTLEEWHKARGESYEVIRDKKDKHIGIKVTVNPEHGFKVPTTKNDICGAAALKWCYGIISEAAPELLENEEVKKAYNDLVDVCAKYPNLWSFHTTGRYMHRYSKDNIDYGFPARLPINSDMTDMIKWREESEKRYTSEEEIRSYYKKLYNLIGDKVETYMAKKDKRIKYVEKIEKAREYIKNAEDTYTRLEKEKNTVQEKINNHNEKVEYCKSLVEKYDNNKKANVNEEERGK